MSAAGKRYMELEKRKPFRSKAIREAANGEACCVCGINDGTTVFCHLNEAWAGKGMGQKADDCAGFFGCRTCHDVYDGRITDDCGTRVIIDPKVVLRAVYRTIRRLLDRGILTVSGGHH